MATLNALRERIEAGELAQSTFDGWEAVQICDNGQYTYFYLEGGPTSKTFTSWEDLYAYVEPEVETFTGRAITQAEFDCWEVWDDVWEARQTEEAARRAAFNNLLGDIQIDL